MSLANLLDRTITLHVTRRSPDQVDQWGNELAVPTEVVTRGHVWPTGAGESLGQQETARAQLTLVLPADVDVAASDRCTIDGVLYEFTGVPPVIMNPRTRLPSHRECRLELVVG